MRTPIAHLLCLVAVFCGLGACTMDVRSMRSVGPYGVIEQSGYHMPVPPPPGDEATCLSSDPGAPGYDSQGKLIGYTRGVVAWEGIQVDDRIFIRHYNGLNGWIDIRFAHPYHGRTPRETCRVVGVDMSQRPIFVIR